MRLLGWALRVLVFAVLLGFAMKNTAPVTVRYYFGTAWQAPLVVVLLIVFVVGTGAGILASLGYLLKQRKQIAQLKRQIPQPDAESRAAADA